MSELSMNQVTTYRWSLEEDLSNYRQTGFRSIGVWRHKLNDVDDDRAVDLLAESGMAVSSLCCAGGFTGAAGTTLRESIDDAISALRMAAAMRAGCLVIHPGGRNNHTSRHASRLLRIALDELLPLAEDCEVPLALEPMHSACANGWTFLTDLESTCQFLQDYDCPYLKIACDTYHFPWDETDRYTMAQLAQQVAIVYLGDRRHPPNIDQHRYPLGCGYLPLAEIVAGFVDAGYAGAFDVRLMGPEIDAADYWALLKQSQAAFAQLLRSTPTRSLA